MKVPNLDKDRSGDSYLLQVALKELGYYKGELDNDFGKQSKEALDRFRLDASVSDATEKDDSRPDGLSAEGIALIKHFESCLEPTGEGRFEAYADPALGWKVPTIGWGTIQYPDGRKVKKWDIIDQDEADRFLAWEVAEKAAAVDKLITVELNPDERGALVAFAYNVGIGNLEKSTLRKKLNAGDREGAADEFLKWDKAGGKVMRGLTRRRKSERNLFLGKRPFIIT